MDLAKRVNELQSKIKAMTRKTMACVSELSMYQVILLPLPRESSYVPVQASAIKLEADNKHKQALLDDANDKLARGEPPTETGCHTCKYFHFEANCFCLAEKEWQRFLRDRETKALEIERQHQEANTISFSLLLTNLVEIQEQMLRVGGSGLCYTTVEARPNAYIPNDLELPRPYGAHAPFKPQEAGSTMRHIMKPSVREIVM